MILANNRWSNTMTLCVILCAELNVKSVLIIMVYWFGSKSWIRHTKYMHTTF